jgi:hypothetical protein
VVAAGVAVGVKVEGLLKVPTGVQLMVGLIAVVDPCRETDCPGSMIKSGPASAAGLGDTITLIGIRMLSHPPADCVT